MPKYRQLFLTLGIVLVLMGLILCFFPQALRIILSIVIGIFLIASGGILLLAVITTKGIPYAGIIFVLGAVNVILGILILLSSTLLQNIYTIIIGIWTLLRGMLLLTNGVKDQKNADAHGRIELMLGGFLVVIAMLIFISPLARVTFITILFGISVIFEGISLILFALKLKKSQEVQAVPPSQPEVTLDIPPLGSTPSPS